ncbi:MAG: hypothetical protein KDB03_19285 [Planctomycetales bacterium]|nr:hypothetical protein [Planctomycetales bacterium]
MIKKPVTGLAILALAAGGPYFLFESPLGQTVSSGVRQVFGLSAVPYEPAQTANEAAPGYLTAAQPWSLPSSSQLNPGNANDAFAPFHALPEVLRFDVQPNWVIAHFPRVTTVLADSQLDGLRVPLVTGANPSDLAGTLTYYFDRYKRLQRTTIHAVTGDPSQIISQLQTYYHLQQVPSLGGGLWVQTWNGQPTSICQIAPAAIIQANEQFARYTIFIELNQSNLEFGLSQEGQSLIAQGRQSQRW